ncbi:MAG: replication-associated recombination protein A [Kiritimatiellaeota bacterium]|nr:replication-associated recombination protein A [Kiritimatiellota bacterium]
MNDDNDDFFTLDGGGGGGVPAAKQPLAARMRPRALDEIIGQQHIVGEGRLLRRVIEADRLSSIILYGPPGCGKTSIAEVIALSTKRRFQRASGVSSNVAALRTILNDARKTAHGRGTILFIDEIHRFNKAQQDVLLPFVEDGSVTLIGATTHNPQMFVNTPLTSRSMVFELKPVAESDIIALLLRALSDVERGLAQYSPVADPEALKHIAQMCEGDARKALNALEVAVLSTPPDEEEKRHVTPQIAVDCVQRKMVEYDKDEEGHYNTISAFIKSIRGSDPHAAIYWLAKMLVAGEDPRFIARRLIISASEDIGNADPRGISVAVAAMQAVEFIGMPEAQLTLAQATTYLATAPKSNASCVAIGAACADINAGRVMEVPEHLRNVHVKAEGKDMGEGYKYPHSYAGNHVAQDYIPVAREYYHPNNQGYEETIAKRMEFWKRK